LEAYTVLLYSTISWLQDYPNQSFKIHGSYHGAVHHGLTTFAPFLTKPTAKSYYYHQDVSNRGVTRIGLLWRMSCRIMSPPSKLYKSKAFAYIFKSPYSLKLQITEERTSFQQCYTKHREPITSSTIDRTRVHLNGPDNPCRDLLLGSNGATLSPGLTFNQTHCDSRSR